MTIRNAYDELDQDIKNCPESVRAMEVELFSSDNYDDYDNDETPILRLRYTEDDNICVLEEIFETLKILTFKDDAFEQHLFIAYWMQDHPGSHSLQGDFDYYNDRWQIMWEYDRNGTIPRYLQRPDKDGEKPSYLNPGFPTTDQGIVIFDEINMRK